MVWSLILGSTILWFNFPKNEKKRKSDCLNPLCFSVNFLSLNYDWFLLVFDLHNSKKNTFLKYLCKLNYILMNLIKQRKKYSQTKNVIKLAYQKM